MDIENDPRPLTKAEADAQNVIGKRNLAKIGVTVPYGQWIAERENEVI